MACHYEGGWKLIWGERICEAVQGRLVRRMATLMNDMILLPPGKSVVSGVRQAK